MLKTALQSQIGLDRGAMIGGPTKSVPRRTNVRDHGTGTEVRMPEDRTALNVWTARAVEALEQALSEIHDNEDPLPSVSLANACLEAEQGLLPADQVEMLEDSYVEPVCICPPDLIARGGFRGGCPVHA